MFQYCVDHLEVLFKDKEYRQALNTTFLAQESSYSWQMIGIFAGVFAVLGLSVYCMCRFMNSNKRSSGEYRRDRK